MTARPSQPWTPVRRVLVADADPRVCLAASAALGGRGYDVLTVSCQAEALSALAKGGFGAVLVDMGLPTAGGLALVQTMRARNIRCAIVMITDPSTLEQAARSMRLGVSNYLHKPFSDDALVGAVAGALLREEGQAPEAGDADARTVIESVRESVAAGRLDLPPIPWVLRELRRLLDDDGHNLPDLARVVERDQELALRVLTRANSAALGGRSRVRRLDQALVQVRGRAVMGLAIRSLTDRSCRTIRDPTTADLAVALWSRAVVTATAARHIAQRLGSARPEEHYLGALLAEIGEPFLLRVLDDVLRRRAAIADEGLLRREIAAHHPQLGEAVRRRWEMEPIHATTAARHHDAAAIRRYRHIDRETSTRLHVLTLSQHLALSLDGVLAPERDADGPALSEGECVRVLSLSRGAVDEVRAAVILEVRADEQAAGRSALAA